MTGALCGRSLASSFSQSGSILVNFLFAQGVDHKQADTYCDVEDHGNQGGNIVDTFLDGLCLAGQSFSTLPLSTLELGRDPWG